MKNINEVDGMMKKIIKLVLTSLCLLVGTSIVTGAGELYFENVYAQDTSHSISDFEGTYIRKQVFAIEKEDGHKEKVKKMDLDEQYAYIIEILNNDIGKIWTRTGTQPSITVQGNKITYEENKRLSNYITESVTREVPIYKLTSGPHYIERDPFFLIFDTNALYRVWVTKLVDGDENIIVWKFQKEGDGLVNSNLDERLINPTLDTISSSDSPEKTFNRDSYEIISYKDIMRDRSGKMLTKHTFYAEVLQYFEDGNNAMAMLMRDGDSNMIYQAYFTSLPENRLVEGDNVDVYGTLMGLESYETVRGSEDTTPVIFIDELLFEGIDY